MSGNKVPWTLEEKVQVVVVLGIMAIPVLIAFGAIVVGALRGY